MSKFDFRELAAKAAAERGHGANITTIEKELLHYEIMRALYESGLLDSMTFQGGTCLRLCYGSPRYSEDLDFSCGNEFDALDPNAVTNVLRDALKEHFDMGVRVRGPKLRGLDSISMRRWTVVVDTAPERADIPAQRVKIEVASCPAYERDWRYMGLNYDSIPSTFAQIPVPVESLVEIAADKMVSLANTFRYVRHRDIWDLSWIASRSDFDLADLAELVKAKHADYGCELSLPALLEHGRNLVTRALTDGGEFEAQMSRFLPRDLYERYVGDHRHLDCVRTQVEALYDGAMDLVAAHGRSAGRRR